MIEAGQWQYFDFLGLAPVIATRRQVRAGDNVLYAGGGNLVPEYRACAKFLAICLKVGVRSALVLPQTIRGHEALLAQLDSRFTLVCRDQRSLAWVAMHAPKANHLFAPDLALFIEPKMLFRRCEDSRVKVAMLRQTALSNSLAKYAVWRLRIRRVIPDAEGVLTIIRTDLESRDDLVGPPEMDLSNLYGSGFLSRAESDLVSRDFLRTLDRARLVVTNRLHVGIGAAIIGKPVHLHDNSYGKNQDVFDASLRDYPRITFHAAPAVSPSAVPNGDAAS